MISEQRANNKTYKVSLIQTILQKIKAEINHNIYLPLFVFTNRQKEEMKKIIVLNTSDLKQKKQKNRKTDITTKTNRLFRYINLLFFFIHHHQHIEDQRFGYVLPQSIHLGS